MKYLSLNNRLCISVCCLALITLASCFCYQVHGDDIDNPVQEQEYVQVENKVDLNQIKLQKRQEHTAKVNAKINSFKEALPATLSKINWDEDEDQFVSEWEARLNKYLSGSPLSGCGRIFAQAAWDNCEDPRFSAAISNTESSKGACCFLSHNAWGWGNSSWSSWEAAIKDHVRGLATKYGYTISHSIASTYCPPNATNWYNKTISQMASI